MHLDEATGTELSQTNDYQIERNEAELLPVPDEVAYRSCSSVTPAIILQLPPSCAAYGSVCYPNVAQFEFRFLVICETGVFGPGKMSSSGTPSLGPLRSFAIKLSKEQIQALVNTWTARSPELQLRGTQFTVTLFFQTYLNPENWQIKRVLNCIFWNVAAYTPGTTLIRSEDNGGSSRYSMYSLESAIMQVQLLHGRASAWYALGDVSLVLLFREENCDPRWMTLDEARLPDIMSVFLTDLNEPETADGFLVHEVNAWESLLQIKAPFLTQDESMMPDLRRNMPTTNSILVIRPSQCTGARSKFCLFVLLDDEVIDYKFVYELLEQAKKGRRYTNGHHKLNSSDKKMLESWSKVLYDMTSSDVSDLEDTV